MSFARKKLTTYILGTAVLACTGTCITLFLPVN